MTILAGQILQAGPLSRLKPVTYYARQLSTLAGPTTNVLVPDCTVTFDTATDNAVCVVTWFLDFDITSAHTGTSLGRARVNGSIVATYADFAGEVVTDRMSPGGVFETVLATAGTQTVDLVATLQTGCQLNASSSLSVVVIEQS